MKLILNLFSFFAITFLLQINAFAQTPTGIMTDRPKTEAGDPNRKPPIDGVVEKKLTAEKRVLPYESLREADIMWEKYVWRVIDTREKLNLPFVYPDRPFFKVLMEAAIGGNITAYSTDDDKFTYPLTPDEVAAQSASQDTIITFDPDTYEEVVKIVRNDINYEDVKRFRVKEVWFFDEESSRLGVRILGIAPLLDVKDKNTGVFIREQPMFWIYYPEAREILAREQYFNEGNDASPLTWEDIMEMRFFSSYIYKASNVRNERIQDYITGGVDRLLEGDKIRQEIFNLEHDLWSY
jgi:gliding motility associated protien GldN